MEARPADEIKAELNEMRCQPQKVLDARGLGTASGSGIASKLYWRCANEQSQDKVGPCCILGVWMHASR